MGNLSIKLKGFLKYRLTIQKTINVDNNAMDIWIVSLFDTIDSSPIQIS